MHKTDPFLITERKDLILNLKKTKGIAGQKAEVVLCLDYSGSMTHHYQSGYVQRILERIMPLGLAFDDNGEVDFYLFEDGIRKLPDNLTLKNLSGYIADKVLGKYRFGCTNYAPAINEITRTYADKSKTGGIFGFGGSAKPFDVPVYVVFMTDGNCDDRTATELAIREASKYGIFFQFVGIGSATFPFLEKLDNLSGRTVDNANFFSVNYLDQVTDAVLYDRLMGEFPQWIGPAKQLRLIS